MFILKKRGRREEEISKEFPNETHMNTTYKFISEGFYLSEPGTKTQTTKITKVNAGKIINKDKKRHNHMTCK